VQVAAQHAPRTLVQPSHATIQTQDPHTHTNVGSSANHTHSAEAAASRAAGIKNNYTTNASRIMMEQRLIQSMAEEYRESMRDSGAAHSCRVRAVSKSRSAGGDRTRVTKERDAGRKVARARTAVKGKRSKVTRGVQQMQGVKSTGRARTGGQERVNRKSRSNGNARSGAVDAVHAMILRVHGMC